MNGLKPAIKWAMPAALAVSSLAFAQTATESPPGAAAPVSRQEYEQFRRDQEAMRREIQDLRQDLARARAAQAAPSPAPAPAPAARVAPPATPAEEPVTREDTDELAKQIKTLRDDLDRNRVGSSTFHIGGDAATGFTAQRGGHSTFDAGVAPLILWQPDKNWLFEAAFDISGSTDSDNNSSTDFSLELANATYSVNNNLYVGAGLFVVPFGQYHRHFDPPWINKFPDDPLAFSDGGIAPGSEVGVFAGGGVPVGDGSKVTYDVYVTNGPNLFTTGDAAGQLNFTDSTDLNNGKAVGGRIGFLPWYNVEAGYSAMFARVNPDAFPGTNAFLQAIDLNWRQDVDWLGGQIDIRGEWVWSNVERAGYDLTGTGPIVTFPNNRNGGYVQACYRPTKADMALLRNFEFVSRYDILRSSPDAPGGDREQRFTIGVDYWFTPAIVLKTAYEFDSHRTGSDANAFMVQLGIGL